MQQQQPGTATHSRISSLPISRRLTIGLELLRDIQFGLSDNNYVCIDMLEVGVASQKSSGTLRAPEAEPPFLNF